MIPLTYRNLPPSPQAIQRIADEFWGPGADLTKISKRHIGSGFYAITISVVKRLCYAWGPPELGYYMPVEFDGYWCNVQRTLYNGKLVWSVYSTRRRL